MSKFEVGVSSGKLNDPPKSCIPRRANMNMNKNNRNKRDMMDDKAFIRAITRFRNGDQYLKSRRNTTFIILISDIISSGILSEKKNLSNKRT